MYGSSCTSTYAYCMTITFIIMVVVIWYYSYIRFSLSVTMLISTIEATKWLIKVTCFERICFLNLMNEFLQLCMKSLFLNKTEIAGDDDDDMN